jgi:hypothetical protein
MMALDRRGPASGRMIRHLNQFSGARLMTKAFLEITLKIAPENRPQAGAVYARYRQAFLASIPGAQSKELLSRTEDVQVLHGFDSKADADGYLSSRMFRTDVVTALKPLLMADPEIRIYECS